MLHRLLGCFAVLLAAATGAFAAGQAALLQDDFPGADRAWSAALTGALQARGFTVTPLSLENAAALSARRFDVLVLPRAEVFPADARADLMRFLKDGGRMVLVGGEPFARMMAQREGRWLDEKDALAIENATPAAALLLSPGSVQPGSAPVAGSNSRTQLQFAVEAGGNPKIGPAVRCELRNFENWANFGLPVPAQPFPQGHTLTTFWARGDGSAPRLSVEWREKDGSRWIAAVPLSTQWQHYALRPEAFQYWGDNSSKGRGGAGDHLRPENARDFLLGFSNTHAPAAAGDHTFWIAGVGTAPLPATLQQPTDYSRPLLEGVSPWYKTYRTENVARVTAHPGQAFLAKAPSWNGMRSLRSPIARSQGFGVYNTRWHRWIPVLDGVDQHGNVRGAAASVLLHYGGDFPHAAWAYLGVDDASFLAAHRESVADTAATLAARLADGFFLTQAGAENVAYFPGERWKLAVEAGNFGRAAADGEVLVSVRSAAGKTVFQQALFLRLMPGKRSRGSMMFPARNLPAGSYTVTSELRRGGAVIDRIQQPVRLMGKLKVDPSQLVTVRGGDFYLGGKPWVPYGVNYWPLCANGTERRDYWMGKEDGHWLSPRLYEPAEVERDLQAMEQMHMNVACIQYVDPAMARPLIDFLERCRKHHIKVMIYGPSGHPLGGFDPAGSAALIKAAHLADSDVVFAYDLAWEPRVGSPEERAQWDGAWRAWIDERYGNVENAERDWGCAARREAGQVVGPSNEQLLNPGAADRMVAAYRRFADDAISEGYGAHIRFLRTLDPHHLMGARSGFGGNGSPGCDPIMPVDLASGAAHFDFISPEGYNWGPTWERTQGGGFVTAYGKLVSGGKPVFWIEYGRSVHPQPDAALLAEQGEHYASFARMFAESGANGGAGWWFPGGYRVDEHSDYGMFNPDRTPRPAALTCRDWAARVTQRRRGAPDYFITVDRDRHPRGFSQVLLENQEEYLRAVQAGKRVALRTAGTGTTSLDCPAIAVGGNPYNGNNVHRWLNGEIESVAVAVGGKWRMVASGEPLKLPAAALAKGIRVRVRVCNTGEAAWACGKEANGKPGAVSLFAEGAAAGRAALPRTAPFGVSLVLPELALRPAAGTITLGLEAEGRARFGQRFQLVLQPAH